VNRRGTRLTLLLVAAFILIVIAVRFLHHSGAPSRTRGKVAVPEMVGVMPVKLHDISLVITLTADIQPINQAAIYSQVSGYLDRITVRRGYRVKKGQLLAHINDTTLKAQYHQAQANRDYVCLNATRYKALLAKSLVSKDAYDLANSQCRQSQATVDYSRKMLSYADIVAPFDGYIFNRMVDPGATIPATTAALSSGSNPLFTVVDTHIVKIVVNVPERDIRYLHLGLHVMVHADAYPGESFPGKITRMNPALDTSTRTLAVEIDMDNPDGRLKPGMFAKAVLNLTTHKGVLQVPKIAILSRQGKSWVYTLEPGSVVKKREIALGILGQRNAEVLSGLLPGQTVVVAGQEHLEDGDHVQAKVIDTGVPNF